MRLVPRTLHKSGERFRRRALFRSQGTTTEFEGAGSQLAPITQKHLVNNMAELVTSLKHLQSLLFRLKRKDIEISKAGSHVKARFRGHSNFMFGSSAEEALQRLMDAPINKQHAKVRARNKKGR